MGWGDELMVTGHARELQQRDPRRVRPVFDARQRDHEAWENNPRIVGKGEKGDFQIYQARVDGLRPYMTYKSGDRYGWKAYGPPVGEFYFNVHELDFGTRWAGRIVLEPHLKVGASPNKDWGWWRWEELAKLMRGVGLVPTQIGQTGCRKLKHAQFVETPRVRLAAALLAKARAAVLPEGALHHVAAAVGCPAVVLFGGFIAPAVTGYVGQTSLFVQTSEHPLGCGWRRPCEHCTKAMGAFPPEMVLAHLQTLLERRN